MKTFVRKELRHAIGIAILAGGVIFSTEANAEETIRQPGAHRDYAIEVEPHLAFGWDNIYGSSGFGGGVRLSVPIVRNGPITTINNNMALSFGADLLHYDNCYFNDRCGANYLLLPAALQWNFFLARHWSMFGEGGAFLYKGFVENCGPGTGCSEPSSFGIRPTLAIGGRYHINDNVTLIARVGYPTISFGVSFL